MTTKRKAKRRDGPWQPIPTIRIPGLTQKERDEIRRIRGRAMARQCLRILRIPEPDPDALAIFREFIPPPDPPPMPDGHECELHEHDAFYHRGGMDADEHKAWLKNKHRHIHGLANGHHREPDGTPRVIWMYDEPGETRVALDKQKMRPPQSSMGGHDWNGLWDNIIRAIEDAP